MDRAIGVSLVLAGCTPAPGEAAAIGTPPWSPPNGAVTVGATPAPTSREDGVLYPGDSLLDHLSRAHVERYPLTNLPEEVVEFARQPFRMRTQSVGAEAWILGGAVSQVHKRVLGATESMVLWMYHPRMARADGHLEVRIIDAEGNVRPQQPSSETLVRYGEFIYWDEAKQNVYAVSEQKPAGIVLEFFADPVAEFSRLELGMRMGLLDSNLSETEFAERLDPRALLRRVDIRGMSRSSLLLPSNSMLAIPFEKVLGDELRVAVGALDDAFQVRDGWVERCKGLSDGVTLQVEIECDGEKKLLWTKSLSCQQLGLRFFDDVVRLEGYYGKKCVLRLKTLCGRFKGTAYDYVVWSDLHLQGAPQSPSTLPNIVLIDIDTLRADRLGCYGYPRATSPNIDEWARARAVVYENCASTAPWTLPSTVSILTGLGVHQHLVHDFPRSLTANTPPLAMLLKAIDYETLGVTDGGYLGPAFGFDLGFDSYEFGMRKIASWTHVSEWIEKRRSDRPFFVFLQTYLVHAPYQATAEMPSRPKAYSGRFSGQDVDYPNMINPYLANALELGEEDRLYISDCYDGEIALMDRMVGEFLERLHRAIPDERLLVILTSDHGEEFFERKMLGHGQSLYQELLHVPMIVQFPANAPKRRSGRESTPVSTLDIVPTVLECVGIEAPAHLTGQSLFADMLRELPRVAGLRDNAYSFEWRGLKLIDGQFRSARFSADDLQLYDLAKDPGESCNLISRERQRLEELRALFEKYRSDFPAVSTVTTSDVDESTRQVLESLGYTEHVPTQSPRSEHPPKSVPKDESRAHPRDGR